MTIVQVLVLMLLVLLIVGLLPGWPHTAAPAWRYGYYPSSGLGLLLVIVLVLVLLGRI